jgi:Methyltransferase domain
MIFCAKRSIYGNTFVYKAIAYFLRPIYSRIKHSALVHNLKHLYLVKKWSHHSDKRGFDWKWKEINYNRIAVVNLLIAKQRNPTYLEIGCASNDLFDSVSALNKVGVDPSAGGTMRMTSDEFFKQNNTRFDVVFIDGLHTYKQVRNDVINTMRFLNKNGWVALHDMLPSNWIEHHVPNVSKDLWTGDVWKVGFELSKTEGIDFRILKVDFGVGVFRVINENVILKDMVVELLDKEFAYFYDNIESLPLIDWDDAQQWLRS